MSDQQTTTSPFETIKHTTDEGDGVLERPRIGAYTGLFSLATILARHREGHDGLCNSGQALEDHFTRVGRMVRPGKGAQRDSR